MASELNKDITRVSTIKVDNREIIVTLNADQTIDFKLKGLKKGGVSIPIQELYNQLTGSQGSADSVGQKKLGNHIINLHDMRSKILINNDLDYKSKTVFEKIVLDLLNK